MAEIFFHDNATLRDLTEHLWQQIEAGTKAYEDQGTLDAIFERFIHSLYNDKDFNEFQEAIAVFFHKIRSMNRLPEVAEAPLLQQAYYELEIIDRVSRRMDSHAKLPEAIHAILNGPRMERLKSALAYAARKNNVFTKKLVAHFEKIGTPTTRQHVLNILSRLEQLGVIRLIPLENAAKNTALRYSITTLGRQVAKKFEFNLNVVKSNDKPKRILRRRRTPPDHKTNDFQKFKSSILAPEVRRVAI